MSFEKYSIRMIKYSILICSIRILKSRILTTLNARRMWNSFIANENVKW